MGLVGLFNKKKKEPLTIDEQRYFAAFKELFQKLHDKFGGEEGYVNDELDELTVSVLNPNGMSGVAVQISPLAPRLQKENRSLDILFDILRNGEGNPEQIKDSVQRSQASFQFYGKTYPVRDIPWQHHDKRQHLPCFTDHIAGETGFWLFLPQPGERPFKDFESYVSVIEACLDLLQAM